MAASSSPRSGFPRRRQKRTLRERMAPCRRAARRHVQRESMVDITGMNWIRHFFAETAPASRPYFVLPICDDGPALYRSIGTGMGLNARGSSSST
jgi:hypothetical protein